MHVAVEPEGGLEPLDQPVEVRGERAVERVTLEPRADRPWSRRMMGDDDRSLALALPGRESRPASAAPTGEVDVRIEIAKESDIWCEVVIRDEDQDLALRMTLGPDGIERIIHDRNRSAVELSCDIAAAIRALSSTLEHLYSRSVRDG